MKKPFRIDFNLILVAGLIVPAALMISSIRAREEVIEASAWWRPSGEPRLISAAPLPEAQAGTICEWTPASAAAPGSTILRQTRSSQTEQGTTTIANRPPIRVIRDEYPNYSAVAVDTN